MPPPFRHWLALLSACALAACVEPCGSAQDPAPLASSSEPEGAPGPEGAAGPRGAAGPGTAPGPVTAPPLSFEPLPLERLLEPPRAGEAPAFRDYRHTGRAARTGAAPEDAVSPLPDEVSLGVSGGTERIDVGGPPRSIERRSVGASVEYRQDGDPGKPAVSVEGTVRDDRSEDLPEREQRDQSLRLKLEVPFGHPE